MMQRLVLAADPDPDLWVRVPASYPDAGAATPEEWARAVAADRARSPEDAAVLTRVLHDLAEHENGKHAGTVYLYLPDDGSPMQKVRLRAVPTEELGPVEPVSPLDPVEDVVDAEHLGRGTRAIVAGRAHEHTDDLLVTVVYRWELGWVTVLLTMATLDPGAAVAMLDLLDELADDVWVEDESGALVTATEVTDV